MSDFAGLVQTLQLALKAMTMYTANHPRTQTALSTLATQLEQWLEAKPSLHFAASMDKLFVDGAPFEGKSVHLTALARQLNERQISGLILQRGVTTAELEALLEVLILKPARLEEAGGAAAVMAKKRLFHVQLSQTQYKEIREGEGGAADHGGAGSGSGANGPSGAIADAMAALTAAANQVVAGGQPQAAAAPQDLPGLTRLWEEQLNLIPQPSLLNRKAFAGADLAFLGDSGLGASLGDGAPSFQQMEALRQSLLRLPPETQLAVIAGMDSLAGAPRGLRLAFQSLASEAFGQAAASLMSSETPWSTVSATLLDTLATAPQPRSLLAALEAELRQRGLSGTVLNHFQELVKQLEWDGLALEDRLRLALEQDLLWTLTLEQRLALLLELLKEGRTEPFLALLERILERLAGEDAPGREHAALTLLGITRWMAVPGLPPEGEGPLLQGLTAHFGWESHAHIHHASAEALDAALGILVSRGEPGQALTLLGELTSLCQFQDNPSDWRTAALNGLWSRLAEPAGLLKVVELIHTANPETMLTEFIPFFEAVGDPACRLLVERLGAEPDRKRRGRLIEAIRGLGKAALPAVYSGLDAPAWYLVRNTLNLLADMGDAGALPAVQHCLTHPDGRVKRAAVRCLWKLCGPEAVPALLATFPSVDPETQMEIIFALGQVRSNLSVPTLAAFAQERRTAQSLRIRAAETLGQIGEPTAIPALAELAQRKGRIFSTAEPTELRLAAGRALMAIGTAEALGTLRGIVAAEPSGKERALLQQVLDTGL